jgi:thiol:disulfide interchange protein
MKNGKNSILRTVLLLLIVLIFFSSSAVVGLAAEKIEKDKILKDEEWKKVYEEFTADDSLIEVLASKTGENLKIDVYLAFWCSDSKRNVPPFLKIIEKINKHNNNLAVNYFTVKRKPTRETKYFVEDLKVERVPTFIFYKDGKEIGRIIENPQKSLIEDFLEIIF